MNTTVIAIADLHVNSTVALAPPTVQLDDGGTYHASRQQHALWDCWTDFIGRVKRIDGRKVLIIAGDLGELDTLRRTNQLISTNKATIISIIIDTIEPLVSVVDQVIVVRGTMAHTGKAAWIEEAIAADLTNAVHDEYHHAASWYHLRKQIGSLRFDVAHHWRNGNRPWTRGMSAIRKAAETRWEYGDLGERPPDVVIRAHNHVVEDSGENYAPIHVWSLPAWTMATEYYYRVGLENKVAQIGGLIFDCDGAYKPPERVIYKPKAAKVWSVL